MLYQYVVSICNRIFFISNIYNTPLYTTVIKEVLSIEKLIVIFPVKLPVKHFFSSSIEKKLKRTFLIIVIFLT